MLNNNQDGINCVHLRTLLMHGVYGTVTAFLKYYKIMVKLMSFSTLK